MDSQSSVRFYLEDIDCDGLVTIEHILTRNAEELAREGFSVEADELDEAASSIRAYIDRHCAGRKQV